VIPSVKHFLRNTFCSGFAKHDEIQLSAGLTGFPPVRKKEIFPAGCAKIGGNDMFRKDAFIQNWSLLASGRSSIHRSLFRA